MATRFINFRGLNADRHPSQIDFDKAQDCVNFEFIGGAMTPLPISDFTNLFNAAEFHRLGPTAEWGRWFVINEILEDPVIPNVVFPNRPFPVSTDAMEFYRQRRFVLDGGAEEEDPLDEWAIARHNFPEGNVRALFQLNGNLYFCNNNFMGRIFGNSEGSFSGDIIAEYGLKGIETSLLDAKIAAFPSDPFRLVMQLQNNDIPLGIFSFNGSTFVPLSENLVDTLLVDSITTTIKSDRERILIEAKVTDNEPLPLSPEFLAAFDDPGVFRSAGIAGFLDKPMDRLIHYSLESNILGGNIWSSFKGGSITEAIDPMAYWRSGSNVLGSPEVEKDLQYIELFTSGVSSGNTGKIGLIGIADEEVRDEAIIVLGGSDSDRINVQKFAFDKTIGHFIEVALLVPNQFGIKFHGMNLIYNIPDEDRKHKVFRQPSVR